MNDNWTETEDEISNLASKADAIEIAGCKYAGDFFERVEDGSADIFSVYFHFTPEKMGDLQGAMCIADRENREDARSFAKELAERYNLPINDYTGD